MAVNSISASVAARFVYQNLGIANREATDSVARISSGSRIVNASDDVAGLAVGTGLQTTVNTLRAGLQNASQTTSLLQVADGALAEVTTMLQRQKVLATQAASSALTNTERTFLDQEFQALEAEIDRLVKTTSFNGVTPLYNTEIDVEPHNTLGRPVQAFDIVTNAGRNGAGPGRLRFVDEQGNNLVGNEAFSNISPEVHGAITNIKVSNVEYGVSADISMEIGGRLFTGIVEHRSTFAFVTNGKDYIEVGTAQFRLDNESRVEVSRARMEYDLHNTRIFRRTRIYDIDTRDTRIEGRNFRVFMDGYNFGDNVNIDNFRYIGDRGVNNSARLAVDINGETFVANNVRDRIQNNTRIRFIDESTRNRFDIRFGQMNPIDADGTSSIREDLSVRKAFLDALNVSFARSGNGVNIELGDGQAPLEFKVDPMITAALYEGKDLGVGDAAKAREAMGQLDVAIDMVVEARADLGSVMSRVDFASANMESSLQNQDAARALYLDTDIAAESSEFAGALVKSQAAISALAQVNQMGRTILQLLQ